MAQVRTLAVLCSYKAALQFAACALTPGAPGRHHTLSLPENCPSLPVLSETHQGRTILTEMVIWCAEGVWRWVMQGHCICRICSSAACQTFSFLEKFYPKKSLGHFSSSLILTRKIPIRVKVNVAKDSIQSCS